jgi:hypothetical protein
MSLLSLPFELVDNIVHYVPPSDLVALSKTCSSLCPAAQRLLYRHIAISPSSNNIGVVATLAKRKDLAHFVRSFSITTAPLSPLFPAFYRILASALSGMTEIISLNLLVESNASWLLEKTGHIVKFLRLQQFNCAFPLDFNVREFLGKTPALLQLEVDFMPCVPSLPIPSLPVTSIPNLVQFAGSPRAARAIVPGRPVESIHLNEGDLVEEDLARLALGTADVTVLGATASTPPVPLLECIARHLPHLAYLRIMTTFPFHHAPEVVSFISFLCHINHSDPCVTQGFMDQVANALAALPDLTAFELSGMQWGSSKPGDGGSKRIWQSAPLVNTFNRSEDTIDSEIFLQY